MNINIAHVSWIATPWYLMENILFIQLSHNNMFHNIFNGWQIK